MNKYTELSDFEINIKVAERSGLHVVDFYKQVSPDDYNDSEIHVTVNRNDFHKEPFDPCNNIEQAWDIMMRYNIGVIKNYYNDTWISVSSAGQVEHKKPLVAVMLCFLEL